MRVSLNWLADYVDLHGLSTAEIAKALTDVGLEVEAVEEIAALPTTIVVGHVLDAQPHPNADSLRVCKVDAGKGAPLPIVCGAPNCRTGLKVALALSGTELPGGIKLKPTKIRGEVSEGMLCSEKELGLSDAHGGIIELPADAPVGTPFVRYKGMLDTVLTLNVTPNRGDCLGMIGVAREAAVKLKREFKMPPVKIEGGKTTRSQGQITITSETPEGCARFVGCLIQNIPQGQSPAWMRRRLESAGMRSVSLMVDVTNYVMLEWGQPIHAYDSGDVSGKKLVARALSADTKFTTLDGQERQLKTGDLVIADGSRVVGIAGIMGGANTEVKASTREIILEVAFFDPARIRQTAKRLALHTEASHRFERTVNIQATADVARRTAWLLDHLATESGQERPTVGDDLVDFYPQKHTPTMIALRLGRAKKLLGLSGLKQSEVESTLTGLGFPLVDHKDERMIFQVPAWRTDVVREADLIEEVARVIGFDRIPKSMPRMEIAPLAEDPMIMFLELARVAAAHLGLVEVITFPFMSSEDLDRLKIAREHPWRAARRLMNPIDEKFPLMVTTLLPNMLNSALDNRRHGEMGVRLFEVGRGFMDIHSPQAKTREGSHLKDLMRRPRHLTDRATKDKRLMERYLLSGIIDQPWTEKAWATEEVSASFAHARDFIAGWGAVMGIKDVSVERPSPEDFPFLHPGQSAVLSSPAGHLGWIGELHPEVAVAWEFGADKSPLVFEIDLEAAFAATKIGQSIDVVSRRFPPATRDLAFLVDRNTTHAAFDAAIRAFPKKQHLVRHSLFDVYEGKGCPEGKKSMAWAFRFQAADRTLNDKEVDGEISALIDWLQGKLSATLRQ